MRDIRFRAWDKKEKTMNYSAEGRIVDGRLIAFDLMIEWRRNIYSSEWELMQFTGLLDKNGKEIYEGDIVKVLTSESGEMLGKVFWWKSCWAVNHGGIKQITYWKTDRELEVIGNIYSNPELAGRTE